jgi:hypothetical protein
MGYQHSTRRETHYTFISPTISAVMYQGIREKSKDVRSEKVFAVKDLATRCMSVGMIKEGGHGGK